MEAAVVERLRRLSGRLQELAQPPNCKTLEQLQDEISRLEQDNVRLGGAPPPAVTGQRPVGRNAPGSPAREPPPPEPAAQPRVAPARPRQEIVSPCGAPPPAATGNGAAGPPAREPPPTEPAAQPQPAPAGPRQDWSGADAFRLCSAEGRVHFEGKVRFMDKARFSSLEAAVNKLNEGRAEEKWVAVFAKGPECQEPAWWVLHAPGRREEALAHFGVEDASKRLVRADSDDLLACPAASTAEPAAATAHTVESSTAGGTSPPPPAPSLSSLIEVEERNANSTTRSPGPILGRKTILRAVSPVPTSSAGALGRTPPRRADGLRDGRTPPRQAGRTPPPRSEERARAAAQLDEALALLKQVNAGYGPRG